MAPSAPQPAGLGSVMVSRRPAWQRYGVSLIVGIGGSLARLAAEPWLHGRNPYLIALPAALFAAWYGGTGPGAAVAAIGLVAGLAVMSDDFPWTRHGPENALGVLFYLIAAACVLLLAEAQRRAREAALAESAARRQSEERMAVTLRSIGDGVITTDVEGRVTMLNPVAEQITGWSDADARGRPSREVFRIINESTRHEVDSPVDRVLREGIIVGLANHTVLVARDGSERPIDDSGAPVRDVHGSVVGAVLVFRDVTERRRAEEESLRLAAIVASSNDAIIGKTLDGEITSWNPGAEHLYGYSRAEAIGRSVGMLLPQGQEEELHGILGRIGRGEKIDNYVSRRRRKDGSLVDVSVSVSALCSADGEVIGASTIARDVTEALRSQEAVRRSEELLSTTLRSIGDAVVATGPEGHVTFMNPVAEALTGWRLEEATQKPADTVMPLVDERTGQPIESPVARVLASGAGFEMQNHAALIARDGSQCAVEDSAAPIRTATGDVSGVVLVFRDVTARRQADAERDALLRRLEEQARLLELAHVLVRDPDSRIVMWNQGAQRLYGFTQEEALGEVSHTLLQTRFPVSVEVATSELFEHGWWDGELIHTRRDGTRVIVASHQVLFRADDGSPLAILEVNNDITALHEARLELQRERAAVQELNVRLRRAMSETHHRVKNNLQVIAALVDMQLMKDQQDVPVAELQRIGQHIRSLAAVHELLTREAKGNGEVEYLRTTEAVARLRPLIEGMVGARELRVSVEDVRLPVRHGTALAVLVNELVSNAVKHGRGAISLSLCAHDGLVVMEVSDDGPGFPQGFDSATSANTGLDLVDSVGRWDLQGKIVYRNRPHGGACVAVEFPLPPDPNSPTSSRSEEDAAC